MPTYEYECASCHRRVEAVQRFTDPALTTCEHCGGDLRKVFSAVGIVFKGSGFYKTDSRPASSTSGASAPSAPKKEPSTAAATPGSTSAAAPAAPAATAPTTSGD